MQVMIKVTFQNVNVINFSHKLCNEIKNTLVKYCTNLSNNYKSIHLFELLSLCTYYIMFSNFLISISFYTSKIYFLLYLLFMHTPDMTFCTLLRLLRSIDCKQLMKQKTRILKVKNKKRLSKEDSNFSKAINKDVAHYFGLEL